MLNESSKLNEELGKQKLSEQELRERKNFFLSIGISKENVGLIFNSSQQYAEKVSKILGDKPNPDEVEIINQTLTWVNKDISNKRRERVRGATGEYFKKAA